MRNTNDLAVSNNHIQIVKAYHSEDTVQALLHILADSSDDVAFGRVAPMQETFDGIRQKLLAMTTDTALNPNF